VNESDALLRLALIPGMGSITIRKLIDSAGSAAAVFDLGMARLMATDGVGGDRARRICDPRGEERLAEERAACHGAGVRIITLGDADYPRALTELHDPPVALWLRGAFEPRDRLAVAIVGPRRPSSYGHRQGHRLSAALARVGACIVSGLARGVDTVAHEAALDARARTIAVLGSGFGRLYPEENRPLADRIAAGSGVVLSEFPFGTPPSASTFPRRNRIVAALALATLVIEAGARSGALITARLAGEFGRTVLAVPGPIDNPECVGSNKLIRDGATLVTSLEDILEEVEPLLTLAGGANGTQQSLLENPRAAGLSGREKQVYQLLNEQARDIDEVTRVAALPPSAVSATMLSLELKRLVRKVPGGYVRAT
jgi:DNA processing protein